jgi:hypothetical protein
MSLPVGLLLLLLVLSKLAAERLLDRGIDTSASARAAVLARARRNREVKMRSIINEQLSISAFAAM